jgi:AraC-like DNA-binding protein
MKTFAVAGDKRDRAVQTESSPPHETTRTYREIRPPAHLAAHIECFWQRAVRETTNAAMILPDGCVDIIWASGRDPFVAGPATLPVRTVIDVGTEICGVRFRPGVGRQILGIDAHEVRDRHALLRDIWPRDQTAAWAGAMDRPSLAAKLEAVTGLIAGRLESVADPDPLVRDAVAWIVAHPGDRVEEIARRHGLSDRQMRRRFTQAVGYGPKTLQRVLRMQHVLWLARTDARALPGLARLALAAGYADQAHMTRELAALTGLTPHQLLLDSGRGSAVSDLFKTTVGGDANMAP